MSSFNPSSCPCTAAVSVTLDLGCCRVGVLTCSLELGGLGCQVITAPCPITPVLCHQARPQGCRDPSKSWTFPKVCCLATSLQLAGRIRAAGESEAQGYWKCRSFPRATARAAWQPAALRDAPVSQAGETVAAGPFVLFPAVSPVLEHTRCVAVSSRVGWFHSLLFGRQRQCRGWDSTCTTRAILCFLPGAQAQLG